MEKAFNIKCRASGLRPNAVVLVATVRALKMHGGGPEVTPGKPLPSAYIESNVDLVDKGCANMSKHIDNARKHGVPVIVAINKFATDSVEELECVQRHALNAGAQDAIVCDHWAKGGAGAVDIANKLVEVCNTTKNDFHFLYDLEKSIEEKIRVSRVNQNWFIYC